MRGSELLYCTDEIVCHSIDNDSTETQRLEGFLERG